MGYKSNIKIRMDILKVKFNAFLYNYLITGPYMAVTHQTALILSGYMGSCVATCRPAADRSDKYVET